MDFPLIITNNLHNDLGYPHDFGKPQIWSSDPVKAWDGITFGSFGIFGIFRFFFVFHCWSAGGVTQSCSGGPWLQPYRSCSPHITVHCHGYMVHPRQVRCGFGTKSAEADLVSEFGASDLVDFILASSGICCILLCLGRFIGMNPNVGASAVHGFVALNSTAIVTKRRGFQWFSGEMWSDVLRKDWRSLGALRRRGCRGPSCCCPGASCGL